MLHPDDPDFSVVEAYPLALSSDYRSHIEVRLDTNPCFDTVLRTYSALAGHLSCMALRFRSFY